MDDLPYGQRIRQVVESFDLDCGRYRPGSALGHNLVIRGSTGVNDVYCKARGSDIGNSAINLWFNGCTGSRVFLGEGLRGDVRMSIHGDGSLVYVGNRCDLRGLEIRSYQRGDVIVIGNEVTTVGTNTWISGKNAGDARPAIIIGDDCMFAYDNVLRNTDAHPIFDQGDLEVNGPTSAIVIEPHVWLNDRAAVLKDVTVGACSVVGFGAVVTRDVTRFAIAGGEPSTVE